MINIRSMHNAGFFPKDNTVYLAFPGSPRTKEQLGGQSYTSRAPQIIMTSYLPPVVKPNPSLASVSAQEITFPQTPPMASMELNSAPTQLPPPKKESSNTNDSNDSRKVAFEGDSTGIQVTASEAPRGTNRRKLRAETADTYLHRGLKMGLRSPTTPDASASLASTQSSDTSTSTLTTRSSPSALPAPQKDEDYSITEQFIEDCNKNLGDVAKIREAKEKALKMRVLGGIDVPRTTEGPIPVVRKNLPLARLSLALLAGIDNAAIKNLALDCLLEILEKDDFSQTSAIGLLDVAVTLSKLLEGDNVQYEIIPMQVKLAQVYSFVLGLLQFHYSKGHINGITRQLKSQLIGAALNLKLLNRRENASVHFFASTAYEGAKRIPDDRLELVEIIGRIWQGCLAVFSLFPTQMNPGAAANFAGDAVSGVDLTGEEDWYDFMLIMREVAEKAIKDIRDLKALQLMIHRKADQLGWKFCFGAIGFLGKVVFYGETADIRRQALEGLPELLPNRKDEFVRVAGIRQFAEYGRLHSYVDARRMYHLQAPHFTNPNVRVRRLCIDYLIWMATAALDSEIRTRASNIISDNVLKETNRKIKQTLEKFIKEHPILVRSEGTTNLTALAQTGKGGVHRIGSGYLGVVARPGEPIKFTGGNSSVPGAPFRFDVTDQRFQNAFIDLGVDTEHMVVSEKQEVKKPRSASASHADEALYIRHNKK